MVRDSGGDGDDDLFFREGVLSSGGFTVFCPQCSDAARTAMEERALSDKALFVSLKSVEIRVIRGQNLTVFHSAR
jgi:hypothetical protein